MIGDSRIIFFFSHFFIIFKFFLIKDYMTHYGSVSFKEIFFCISIFVT